jgi:SAM-dependent methyltransferase
MFEVLQNKQAIEDARESLEKKGCFIVQEGWSLRHLRSLGLVRSLPVGDHVKSWDVNRTLDFIAAELPKDAQILDFGAYCSEVPVALARMGYTRVHGVDLNPKVQQMPFANKVNYSVGNFMQTHFQSQAFDAVTAISVIEHGYDPDRLFSEVGRLLKSGGYFVASFDYWPEKIDTGNTKFFDMSWLIFSSADVERMFDIARNYGFSPAGELYPTAKDRAIHCAGYDYTFGWVVLKKDN